jgi:rSAM/selenodomain-associated transferase 2/rSAM/selenodomain-associated transferase 1
MLTRHPRLGDVKRRIAATLGDEAALDIHDRLARHTLRQLLALSACDEARVEVRSDASFVHATREWLGRGPRYRYQGEGDLGRKILFAFAHAFDHGDERVVVVGSDCPWLTARHLRQALEALDSSDVVIGPATDGGYYLVGLVRRCRQAALPFLFEDVPWGSSDVLAQTQHIAENQGLSTIMLEELNDVDVPEDVAGAEAALAAARTSARDRVSVVIPALDDEDLVGDAVRSAIEGGAYEVIVVDGGSHDATREVAERAGARTVTSAPGRAVQMNTGARLTRGEILCFLHADTLLPMNHAQLIRAALADSSDVAAAFDFRVAGSEGRSALISALGQARWRVTRMPYGDQAICVPRFVFEALDGFPELPTMEDYAFSLRLKKYGAIARIPVAALTSRRAWDEHGLLVTTAVNVSTITGYRLGVSPHRLAKWRSSIAPDHRQTVVSGHDTRGQTR